MLPTSCKGKKKEKPSELHCNIISWNLIFTFHRRKFDFSFTVVFIYCEGSFSFKIIFKSVSQTSDFSSPLIRRDCRCFAFLPDISFKKCRFSNFIFCISLIRLVTSYVSLCFRFFFSFLNISFHDGNLELFNASDFPSQHKIFNFSFFNIN